MAKQQKSLKGHFLLDGGNLAGSFFHRSVVFICQHNAEGAFGLILNRPMGTTVGEALPGNLPESLQGLTLMNGGPVQPQALTYLYSEGGIVEQAIMTDLGMGHSLDELIELAEKPSLVRKIRVFAGYAGWSPGQLEDEIQRDAWMVQAANLDKIFSTKPEDLWRQIIVRKGWKHRLMADGPDDLSQN